MEIKLCKQSLWIGSGITAVMFLIGIASYAITSIASAPKEPMGEPRPIYVVWEAFDCLPTQRRAMAIYKTGEQFPMCTDPPPKIRKK